MGTIHNLIMTHGAAAARATADSKSAIQAIDAAAAIMAQEEGRLAITHAGFAMTNLPHKAIAEHVWHRKGPSTTLIIESGRNANNELIGVPYGSMARLILLYLQSEAIRTGSPEVEMGGSMKAWMERMGLKRGGKTYHYVAEQARRIASCRLTFFSNVGSAEMRENGAFVRGALSLSSVSEIGQMNLWQDTVRLDDGFWKSLQEHPVPVREEAIRAINSRSMALDIYVWLAYRLHALTKPTSVTWTSLYSQFGSGFKHMRQMKPKFIEALNLALAVYPEAHVDITDTGLTLFPSPPAVSKTEAHRLRLS